MPPRFCQSCGAEIPDNITSTCPKCGNPPGVSPDKMKSSAGAAFLSLVIPGLGQAYCGTLLKAIGVLLAFMLALSLFIVLNIGFGFYLLPLVWVIGIADAYRTATQMNGGKPPWQKSAMFLFGIFAIGVGILFFFVFMISAVLSFFPATGAPSSVSCVGAEGCLHAGITQLQRGNSYDADKFFQKVLVEDSRNATALGLIGVVADRRGNQTMALALFDQSLTLDPNQSAVWNNRGVVAARMGDTSAAGAGFGNAVKANPNESVAWYNLGTWLSASGDDTAAIAALDRAIALSPGNTVFLLKKGRTLNAIGDYSVAVNVFGTVTNASDEYVPALLGKGEALDGLGRYGESCTAFDAAIGVNPCDKANIWSAVYNSTSGMYEPVNDWRYGCWDNKGGTHISDYDRKLLLSDLTTCDYMLEKDPRSEYALQWKGETLISLQQYDEAIDTFNAANSIGNGSAKALNGKGMAEFFKGDNMAALDSFSLASAKDPSFIPSWNNRAFVLWRQGQDADAVEAYRHAVQLDSKQQSRKYDFTLIVAFDGRKL